MTFEQLLPYIVGPFGGFVILAIICAVLWRAHQRSDRRNEEMLDRQLGVNEKLADSIPELTRTVAAATQMLRDQRG